MVAPYEDCPRCRYPLYLVSGKGLACTSCGFVAVGTDGLPTAEMKSLLARQKEERGAFSTGGSTAMGGF